jgi:transcriptional regulator with XRE-family HTH domain
METLEGRVGAYLAQNHVKKHELADEMGVSVVTLSRKTSGRTELLFSEARKLSEILGIDLDELYSLTTHDRAR